ncbi:MAG: hypothetical protein EA372_02630 [Chromatiaceae bacterium]|nr:MAG: hypothetical protein EA372_02630 [Chromatiaceae bacterium]
MTPRPGSSPAAPAPPLAQPACIPAHVPLGMNRQRATHGLPAQRPRKNVLSGSAVDLYPPRRGPLARAGFGLALLTGLWVVLTGGAAESWVMGGPAVLAGTMLIFLYSSPPRWRLSPAGALRFGPWFALRLVMGALDVARRALAWRQALAPGCRVFRTTLPEGAPRLLFANVITLLPGTLTAGIHGDLLVVHMLDTDADVEAQLRVLEARIAALFGLPTVAAPKAIATGDAA